MLQCDKTAPITQIFLFFHGALATSIRPARSAAAGAVLTAASYHESRKAAKNLTAFFVPSVRGMLERVPLIILRWKTAGEKILKEPLMDDSLAGSEVK
jgi:hypothetical protein